jgi:hypothetical protein
VDAEGVSVVHAVPGRVRLKVTEVKNNLALAQAVRERLSALPGIRGVETNIVTGSVLVLYEMAPFASGDPLRSLTEVLTPLFPALDVAAFRARLTASEADLAPHGNGSGSATSLERGITSLLGTLNAGVGKATGGVDLKLLVPLALFCLGMRELLVAERVLLPSWYDFIWFSFGTFIGLNVTASSAHG